MPMAFTFIILDYLGSYLGPFSCDTRDSFHFNAASKAIVTRKMILSFRHRYTRILRDKHIRTTRIIKKERIACRLDNAITVTIKFRVFNSCQKLFKMSLREKKREKRYRDCREIIMKY